MRKSKGHAVAIIAGILAGLALIGVIIYSLVNNKTVDYNAIQEPNEQNGYIGDHLKGPATAPVLIFEYADYQCYYCAMLNPYVTEVINIAEGNLAIVYRNYILDYHKNAQVAAAAAEAAGLQSYFSEYSNQLFTDQDEWDYATEEKLNEYLESTFTKITDGAGNLDQFNADRTSENVAKKVKSDTAIGNRLRLSGTPAFYYEGQFIDFSNKAGGSITVKGETLSWDHSLSGSEFAQILLDIVNINLYVAQNQTE